MLRRKTKTSKRPYAFKEMLVTYTSDELIVTMRRIDDTHYELVSMANSDGVLVLHCVCEGNECQHAVKRSSVEEILAAAEEMIAAAPDMQGVVGELQGKLKETLH